MKVLSIHSGHDASICLFEDFHMKFIAKEERLDRKKNSGRKYPKKSIHLLSSKFSLSDIDVVAFSRTQFLHSHFKNQTLKKKIYALKEKFLGRDYYQSLAAEMRHNSLKETDLIDIPKVLTYLGLPNNCKVFFIDHHFAHALPVVFFQPNWDNGLVYTCDGGGDFYHYNIYHFENGKFDSLHGNKPAFFDHEIDEGRHSLGQMYSLVTEIAGFKKNRHEGKITGLAAYGTPTLLKDIKDMFFVNNDGLVRSHFGSYSMMKNYFYELSKKGTIEELAASAQTALEELITSSIECFQRKFKFDNIGLSGGVFANVRLNQKISEIDGVNDLFVFPPMGDEGLVIGMCLSVLKTVYGDSKFFQNRMTMPLPYWGENYESFDWSKYSKMLVANTNIAAEAAELLEAGKICALYTNQMEYGPRALGARSILINPSDQNINKVVNDRLERTEFMPFAPYIRSERLADVFIITNVNKQAMKFMTITTDVKENWKQKIPAVVHVDGTARPQYIDRKDNPLYYDILKEFEIRTGIPCLVNTSFNAHEEPIINTPNEAFHALENNRIDYLITHDGIFGHEQLIKSE